MNRWNVLKKNWLLLVLGITLIMLGYLSWGLFTISYKSVIFKWLGGFFSVLTVTCYGVISCFCRQNETGINIRNQWLFICTISFLIHIMLIIRNGISLWDERRFLYLFLELLWCAISIYSVLLLTDREFRTGKIRFFLVTHIRVIILIAVTGLLCKESNTFQYKWDGLLYYLTCQKLHLESLSSLAIYGHIAQTFGALVQVANLITGNTAIAMLAVNLILMLIGIIYFYAIIKYCLPNIAQWEYVLITAIFAWSPYVLGMVHYYSLDFICQCLLPPVVYYFMKKQWILFSFFSLLFCFTKEPAIIVYGALCASAVILDFMRDKGFNWKERIKNLFERKQYYIMIMPGILWLVTYEILGPWSAGEGGFGIDFSYVLAKLQNLYVLNFNWIFTIAVIIGIIIITWKKDYELFNKIFPILCMQLAFTAFSCLFKTINHPRYNDTNQVTLYLLAIILVFNYINIKKIRVCFSMILAFVLVLSSFYTIDPISLLVYPVYSVGEVSLIMTGTYPFGDGMIYNRQMLNMEKALDLAITDSISDDILICFPTIENNPYFFDGMSEVARVEEYRFDVEYWDVEKNVRITEQGSDAVEFTVCQIGDFESWLAIQSAGNNQIDLIYMAGIGEEYYLDLKARYTLMEENPYVYNGWVVYRARFDLEL